jgi:hypothetical protein
MSAKASDINSRLAFIRDFAIGALLIGGAILILALPSVQNFLAAAASAGDGALARAGAIGLTAPAIAVAFYGLRKGRFGFAAGLIAVPLALALYAKAVQAEHARDYAALESGPLLKPAADQKNILFDDPYWMNFWLKPILSSGKYVVFSAVRQTAQSPVEWREARLVSGAACREANNLPSTVEFTANGFKDTCIAALPAREPAPTLIIKIGVGEIVKGFQGLWIEILERAGETERLVARRAKGLVPAPAPFLGIFGVPPLEVNGFDAIGDVIGEVLSVSVPRDYTPPRGDVTDEHEISAALEQFFVDSNPAIRKTAEIEYGKLSVNHCPAPESAELAERAARLFLSPYLDVRALAYFCVRDLPPAAREPFQPQICRMIADAKQTKEYFWLVDLETKRKTACPEP